MMAYDIYIYGIYCYTIAYYGMFEYSIVYWGLRRLPNGAPGAIGVENDRGRTH